MAAYGVAFSPLAAYQDKTAENFVFSQLGIQDPPLEWGWFNPMLPPFEIGREVALFRDALEKKDCIYMMDILTGRRWEEVQQIRGAMKEQGVDLISAIEGKTVDGVERVFMALARDPCEFDAWQLHEAISGIGTTDNVIIEVLSSRTKNELNRVEQWYYSMFGKSLRDDIRGDTMGNYEQLCLALLDSNRDAMPFSPAQAVTDAQALIRAGEGRLGTDDDRFISLFANTSRAHLMAVAVEYNKISTLPRQGDDDVTSLLDRAIEGETSGSYRDMLRALLNPERFLAKVIHDAIEGFGTNDAKLVRTLRRASSTPARLFGAKHLYNKIFKKSLLKDVEDDTHGVYKFTLRRLAATHQGAYIAVLLREAINQVNTDELAIANTLINHVPDERHRADAALAYKSDYGKDLVEDVSCFYTPDMTRVLRALCTPRYESDAANMHFAMDRVGTKESVLIDILTTRSNRELYYMKEAYSKLYHRSLGDDIEKETSGNFEKILLKLLDGSRREGCRMDPAQAANVAQDIYKAGEGKLGTNDSKFIEIFTGYSWEELALVDQAYRSQRGHGLADAIKSETSGDFRDCLQACLDPNAYIAKLLHGAMDGVGTDDQRLVRVAVHRPRREWPHIKAKFALIEAGKTLEQFIKGDVSGKPQTVFLMITQ